MRVSFLPGTDNKMGIFVLLALCSGMACSPVPVAAEKSGGETTGLALQLDDEDVRIRAEAVETLRQYLQMPVVSHESAGGCFSVEAPGALECSESAEFCVSGSGIYVSGNQGREVVWAYPKDPPEVFEEEVFFKGGSAMGFGSGQIGGGIPLMERYRPSDADFACEQLRPGIGVGSTVVDGESDERAYRRRIDRQRLHEERMDQRKEYESCIEELEEQRQQVSCEVVFVNPCRKEAFMVCQEDNAEAGKLTQIDLPRDELLRISWEEGTEEMSAFFTVEIEAVENLGRRP